MLGLEQRVVHGVSVGVLVDESVDGRERASAVLTDMLLNLGDRLNRQSHPRQNRRPKVSELARAIVLSPEPPPRLFAVCVRGPWRRPMNPKRASKDDRHPDRRRLERAAAGQQKGSKRPESSRRNRAEN